MHTNIKTSRLQGLDTLRALAITLVLMTHYCGFVSHKPTFGFIGDIGWSGVDLFFVLSGYLIGNQVLSSFARGESFSLGEFFAKRFLRTLPNYYVVLAVYFLLPIEGISGSGTASIWRFLTFTQNYGQPYGVTFSHSWSLCIEEQFYLILPVAALLVARCSHSVRVGWMAIGGAIAVGMAARAAAYLAYGYDTTSAEVYYSSFARFDELLPGVAIAMLKNFHGDLFNRILRRGNALLAVGLAASATVLFFFQDQYRHDFFVTTFSLSILAASYGVLVLAALSPDSILSRYRVPGAGQLALWSYAVYLAHKPIFMATSVQLKRLGIDGNAPLTVVLVVAGGVFGGWVLYRVVETPFMQLRARLYPSMRPQAVPAPVAQAA
jgi:peptidoglycan/LPS O-acetylase OafA/YrhL